MNNMPIKDPTTWSLATWALAIGMAFAGGFVNWYTKVRQGHARVFNIVELINKILISGFVGVAVFMMLASYDQPMGLCAAASGVSGHMGTRLLFLVEQFVARKIKTEIDKNKQI